MQKDQWVGTISISWDKAGRINHDFKIKFRASAYEIDDGLAFSSVVSIASQLGVVSIRRALGLCSELFHFLETGNSITLPINDALSGVDIEFRQSRRADLFHLFHPRLNLLAGNDAIEDGVCQFLINYLSYINLTVTPGFQAQIKNAVVLILLFFLEDALGKVVRSGFRHIDRNNWDVQKFTLEFSATFYPYWNSLDMVKLSQTKFQEILTKSNREYQEIIRNLGI